MLFVYNICNSMWIRPFININVHIISLILLVFVLVLHFILQFIFRKVFSSWAATGWKSLVWAQSSLVCSLLCLRYHLASCLCKSLVFFLCSLAIQAKGSLRKKNLLFVWKEILNASSWEASAPVFSCFVFFFFFLSQEREDQYWHIHWCLMDGLY